MDATQIYILAMTFLAPLAGSALTSAAEEGGKSMIESLKSFLMRRGQEKALSDVQANPQNEEAREQLRIQIAQAAKYDAEFIPAMTKIIESFPQGIRQIVDVQGSIRSAVGMKANSVGKIDQGVRVTGDIEGEINMEADNR